MQLPMIRKAKEMGLRVIAIDNKESSVALPYADQSHVFDLADRERCLQIARQEGVVGVTTMAADYPQLTIGYINEALGLSGLDKRAATVSTNKAEMRRSLALAKIPCPIWRSCRSIQEAATACREINGPTIFKPCLGSGGRGIVTVPSNASLEFIESAYGYAATKSRNKEILVEELIEGPEFSIEAISFDGRARLAICTDKRTSGAPHHVEIGHSQPSRLPQSDIDLLTRTAEAALRALGLDRGPSHTEIRVSDQGPVVMEVGARLGGGFITSHLVPLSSGIDMVGATIQLAMGQVPELGERSRRPADVEFITRPPGRIRRVSGYEEARRIAGVEQLDLYVGPGDKVGPLTDATARLGHMIIASETWAGLENAKSEASSLLQIEIEQPTGEPGDIR